MERRMIRYFFLTVLTVTLITGTGCKLNDGEKDVVVNIDTEFFIDLNEKLGTSPNLVFELESVETMPCMNSTIDHSITFTGSSLRLSINGIEDTLGCIPGNAQAKGNAFAGSLPKGQHKVVLNIRNTITNEGTLTVAEEKYELQMETSNGISFKNLELRRIPEYTIWGYIAAEEESKAGDFPARFLKDLDAITSTALLEDGYYGYFSIQSNELILRNNPPDMNQVTSFYFNKIPADGDQLKNLLEQYRAEAGNDVAFKIFTWQGETL